MARPGGLPAAFGAALLLAPPAVGQTLKATAPEPSSPAHGVQAGSRNPALTVRNAQGLWAAAAFSYRFEIAAADDPATLAAFGVVPQGVDVTTFTPTVPLDYDRTYWWRARAELDGAFGPWSPTRSFTTSARPRSGGRLAFSDVSAASGVSNPVLGGHGVMFADATGDRRPDLYVTMNFNDPVADQFFVNGGDGRFTEAGAARGAADFDVGSHGAAFADLDNDGDYDLINGATGENGAPNNVFRNDGFGRFTDATPQSMANRREPTRAMLAFDMDRDGDLDIFGVSGWKGSGDPPGERNEVYRNDDGAWHAVTTGALHQAPAGQGATDTDFDGDGDIDVIAANRDGDLNILRNDGSGTFRAVDPDAVGIGRDAYSGVTAADVDNDGDVDLLLVGLAGGDTIGYLYRNLGGGRFAFTRAFTGIDGYMGGFADLDHDGDLDLVFAGDDVSYLNDGRGEFRRGPEIPTAGVNDPRAVAFADVDADGDLDFAVGAKRSPNRLFRNDNRSGNWLKVRLVTRLGQAGAFGAKVSVYPAGAPGSAPLGVRESRSGNGYLGQDDPVLHFGLGDHRSVTVIATFLDGAMRVLAGVSANQTVTVDGAAGGASAMFVEPDR